MSNYDICLVTDVLGQWSTGDQGEIKAGNLWFVSDLGRPVRISTTVPDKKGIKLNENVKLYLR
jgi:hypothetical protein